MSSRSFDFRFSSAIVSRVAASLKDAALCQRDIREVINVEKARRHHQDYISTLRFAFSIRWKGFSQLDRNISLKENLVSTSLNFLPTNLYRKVCSSKTLPLCVMASLSFVGRRRRDGRKRWHRRHVDSRLTFALLFRQKSFGPFSDGKVWPLSI